MIKGETYVSPLFFVIYFENLTFAKIFSQNVRGGNALEIFLKNFFLLYINYMYKL